MHYLSDACLNPVVGDTFDFCGMVFEVCEAEDEIYPCTGCYFDGLVSCPRCRCSFKIFKVVEKEKED